MKINKKTLMTILSGIITGCLASCLSFNNDKDKSKLYREAGIVVDYDFNEKNDIIKDSASHLEAVIHGADFVPLKTSIKNYFLHFDGNSYVEIPSHDNFSPASLGNFSIAFWMKAERLNYTLSEKPGYVYLMGKGERNEKEWGIKVYNLINLEGLLKSRIGFFLFPKKNGLQKFKDMFNGNNGLGIFAEDYFEINEWMHIAAIYDSGNMKIYQNGKLKNQNNFPNITFEKNNKPFRIGTLNLQSFFEGDIDNLKIYNRSLSDEDISNIFVNEKMFYNPFEDEFRK